MHAKNYIFSNVIYFRGCFDLVDLVKQNTPGSPLHNSETTSGAMRVVQMDVHIRGEGVHSEKASVHPE